MGWPASWPSCGSSPCREGSLSDARREPARGRHPGGADPDAARPAAGREGIRADEIAALILGSAEAGAGLFWRPLISGQLDADRMDYLLRNSHHAGVQYGRYDWHRIINTVTVAPPEEDRGPRVGVTEGGWNAAEGLIIARYMMFNQVYYHKTRVALDFHLQCACPKSFHAATFRRQRVGLQEYLDWDDWRVLGLFAAGEGGEHAKRLRERDLFREIRHTPAYPGKSDDKLLGRWRLQLGGFWPLRSLRTGHGTRLTTQTYPSSLKTQTSRSTFILLFTNSEEDGDDASGSLICKRARTATRLKS